MLDVLISDVLFLSSDLLTGKSLPLLVGITVLPIDRHLLGMILGLGVATGLAFTMWSARVATTMIPAMFAMRLVNLGFSMFLSLSFFLRLGMCLHTTTVGLAVVPVFVLHMQKLPERPSTHLILFFLTMILFWMGLLSELSPPQHHHAQYQPVMRQLLALNRMQWQQHHLNHQGQLALVEPIAAQDGPGALVTFFRVLLLYILAFYASVHHGPTQVYFSVADTTCNRSTARYLSHVINYNAQYTLGMAMIAALVRIFVYLAVCYFQNNALHVLFEFNLGHSGSPWVCAWIYLVTLLYSSVWSCTQLLEQVFPWFSLHPSLHKIKAVGAILVFAVYFHWKSNSTVFMATSILSGCIVFTTILTLKLDHRHMGRE
jgi:hypothetical protein